MNREEMWRRRVEVMGPYGNMEFGRAPLEGDRPAPYLKAALAEAVPTQTHTTINWRSPWVWLGAMSGLAMYAGLIVLVIMALKGDV